VAVYQFSALSDGQAISFNPNADTLNFDQTAVSAADVRATAEGTSIRMSASGKEVFLLNAQLAQLTTTNVTFANGSLLLFGDNTTAQTADSSGNSLTGSSGNDHLWGFGGNDTLNGGTGNDWLAGGTGQDNIAGGAGNDSIVFRETPSNNNFDRVSGFVSGEDRLMFHEDVFGDVTLPGRIVYNSSNGYLYFDADGSGAGRAQLVAILQGAPTLAAGDIGTFDDETTGGGGGGATEGNDTLVGTPGDDSIDGLGGNDLIQTLGGNDTLRGSAGADTLEGGDGNDTYELPQNGVDTIRDTSGTDVAIMHGDVAILAEGSGVENLIIVGAPDAFDVATGRGNELDNFILNDSNFGFAWLSGQEGDDTIVGKNNGSDEFGFFAPGGDYGNDTVDGGESVGFENDLLDFRGTVTGVVVDFRSGTASGGGPGGSGSVSFTRIESVIGGAHGDRLIADDSGQMNWMMGYLGNDTLIGGAADDNLEGDSEWSDHEPTQQGGSDELFGNGGNDNLRGWAESDSLNGGAGNDELDGDEQFAFTDAFVFDQPAGAANADLVMDFGYGGVRDELHLGNGAMPGLGAAGRFSAGDARFFSGAGANSGQDASDRVVYDTTTGQLWYDADGNLAGAAQLIATLQGAPVLIATDIIVFGGAGAGPINGTEGDDSITGTGGNDTMNGLGGDDDLMGEGGDDVISGGAGNDFLLGGEGTDSLSGGEGNDSLAGYWDMPWVHHAEADTLDGGLGDDVYYVRGETEVLIDAGGVDTVITNVDWTLAPGFENMLLDGPGLVVHGNELGNRFENFPYWTDDEAYPPASTIFAGGGNDTFAGAWGGATTIFHGEDGDDVALGDLRGSTFTGGAGRDTLSGGGGDDWLEGGTGQDSLTGGEGADSFVFREPAFNSNFDRILDFESGADMLRFDDSVYTAIGAAGDFAAGDDRFFAAPGARSGVDAEDRLVYNTTTGVLWYDADGSGPGGQLFVATLQGAPSLAASDIAVI
jgi:Ca2+-binding RTX toxin-like protein